MDAGLREAVEKALGARVTAARALGGGEIHEAYAVTLGDGARVFVKHSANAPADMFPAEAAGLAWLAEAGAIRTPAVLACTKEEEPGPRFLALELLEPGARTKGFDEELGRSLAAMHRAHPERFGLDRDSYVGRLPQANRPESDWPTFYRTRRLAPLAERAREAGLLDARVMRAFDALFGKLDALTGPPEAPARLHGDLWGGNLHVTPDGRPCLIDPAAYGGHREIDLAMMRLFGGFGARVFAAYDETYPLAEGHEERVALYQLYPLLVHVNLFGAGYVTGVERALARYVPAS